MRSTANLALAFLILLSSTAHSAFAQAQSEASTDKFHLSASVNAKAQLSRTEMDRGSLGMGSLMQPKPVAREAILARAQEPPKAAPPAEEPGSYLQEYNVNWSGWISNLADRWYYVLRSAEEAFGVQFSTPRPALIQFTCYADGTIGNVVLKQSSGVPAYDRLQIEALLSIAPTPRFPAGTRRNSITLCQGWESHPKRPGEEDFQPGSFGKDFPLEKVRQWLQNR